MCVKESSAGSTTMCDGLVLELLCVVDEVRIRLVRVPLEEARGLEGEHNAAVGDVAQEVVCGAVCVGAARLCREEPASARPRVAHTPGTPWRARVLKVVVLQLQQRNKVQPLGPVLCSAVQLTHEFTHKPHHALTHI